MSPGYKSRAAELGGDPARLQEFVFVSLNEAIGEPGPQSVPANAAVAQAAAVALLAVQLGRLAAAIEADNASIAALPIPYPPAPQS